MSNHHQEIFAKDVAPGRRQGSVLVVDDEPNIRSSLKMVLTGEGYEVNVAPNGDDAEKILSERLPDVIMLDVRMPGRSGLELLASWSIQHPKTPIVMMSGEATISEALDGLKAGAFDFLEKPLVRPKVMHAIKRALETCEIKPDRTSYEIVGTSKPLHRLLNQVKKIAPLRTRVLITGESGTGKDLVARSIHDQSARQNKPFVKINCAAIPAELVESELFGHVKGAFTGATSARRGLFETAHGGTLFLDEIGELPLAAQAKILRALQNGEISPVGSDRIVNVDVRVIAATNRDLKVEVEGGRFREDLYYRVAVVCLEVPSLRERPDDIPQLVRHFAEEISHENGLPLLDFDPHVWEPLQTYGWPGNIRELRNIVERLIILGGPVIGFEDLPADIQRSKRPVAIAKAPEVPKFQPTSWDDFKRNSERDYLIQVLRHCHGNISEAARVLGVERSTVHKWLKSSVIKKHHYMPKAMPELIR